jgi:hypothetical protein
MKVNGIEFDERYVDATPVAAFAGYKILDACPGAHAPSFMLPSATAD